MFFNAPTCSTSRIIANCESLVSGDTIDDCCEDFLHFRHSDKLSRTLVLSVSPFLGLVNSSFYFFFSGAGKGGLSLAYSEVRI